MKMFLCLMTILSSNIFACPDIAGRFLCQAGTNIKSVNIEDIENGFSIETSGVKMDYFYDGKTYELPSTETYKDFKIISSCKNDTFQINYSLSILDEGSVIAKEVAKTEYSLDGDKLIIVEKTKMKGLPLPTRRFICTRNW